MTDEELGRFEELAGESIKGVSKALLDAYDPDVIVRAKSKSGGCCRAANES